MIRHGGACVLFSVLILVLASVVLYRPEPRQSSVPAPESIAEAAEPPPIETPVQARPEPEPRLASPVAEPTAEPSPIRAPEAPLTLSEPGETLEDVALRIYGSTEAARLLLQANPDRVDRSDTPIKPGSVIRTPPIPGERGA